MSHCSPNLNEIDSLKWQQVPVGSEEEANLTLSVKNHAVVHHNDILYLLGGSYMERMDLILYDLREKQWTRVRHEGEVADSQNHSNDGNNDGSPLRLSRQAQQGQGHAPARGQNRSSMHIQRNSFTMTGIPPSFRNGHTATLVKKMAHDGTEKCYIYIIGGWLGHCAASDLHILDITNPAQSLAWMGNSITMKGISPGPCNMHSADFIPDRREIYVFRGGDGSEYLNDLHALNVDTMTWRKVQTQGEAPEPRADHSSTFMKDTNELFIFGGWNGRARLNDFHVLNTATSTWTQPNVEGTVPQPRAGMTLTAVRDRLFLFGGNGIQSTVCNDLHVLDRSKMAFLELVHDESNQKCTSAIQTKDQCSTMHLNENQSPSFASTSHWDSGGNIQARYTPERYVQNQCSNQNMNPNSIDDIPKLKVYGKGPGRRAGHTATIVDRFIYIIGGSSGSEYRNDCFALDTDCLVLPSTNDSHPHSPPHVMLSRLKSLCNCEEFSDVVFILEGRRRIYAHKMVLSLASEFYNAMFRNEFRERANRAEIEIPNCSYDAFLAIMEYMYTGSVDLSLVGDGSSGDAEMMLVDGSSCSNGCSYGDDYNDDGTIASQNLERLLGILAMSDQLLLDDLKQKCERALRPMVNSSTVEYLMQISQQSNAPTLGAICKHFLRNRNSSDYLMNAYRKSP